MNFFWGGGGHLLNNNCSKNLVLNPIVDQMGIYALENDFLQKLPVQIDTVHNKMKIHVSFC